MSVTLTPPIRVAALVGALVLTGAALFLLLLSRGALGGSTSTAAQTAPTVQPGTHGVKPAPTPKPTPKPAHVSSGFPAKVDHALRYRRIVVVSVSVPGSAVDRAVRREARVGAKASNAAFVGYSAANEAAMGRLLAKTGVLPAPAVIIVKRPGVVASRFSVADSATIAQAVAQARR